ncbi:MAG: CoA transferase [Deltaproteobacteria bacterium]|nr:CoA transferase [Deltaproteobacteria bacterium]
MSEPLRWTHALLAGLGRGDDAPRHALSIDGTDPILASALPVGEAAAAVLAAQAAAAADLWCARGGAAQQIAVDVHAAAASLLSFAWLRLPGHHLLRDAPATVALYRCADGWVHLHGGFPHLHRGTLDLLGCDDGAAAIAAAVASWPAQELEDALAARRLCGARLRSAAAWNAHPQGLALAGVPLVELIRIGEGTPTGLPGPPAGARGARPLSGVRVLDLTRVLAGPTCARTLAAHGADVLHVRAPQLPFIEPFVIDTNPGKRSCYLDLTRPAQRDQLDGLLAEADVFVQGYRPGALARRGYAPATLAARRPGLIVASLSCYGHDGPWAERPGWEQLAQTATGMAHAHAGAERPALVAAAVTDYITGHLAALGVLLALARRAREGGAWHVRVSLARTAMWLQELPRASGTPRGIEAAALAPWWIEMDTAWGRLRRLGPIERMSATPPHWQLPPAPLGSDPAAWPPR